MAQQHPAMLVRGAALVSALGVDWRAGCAAARAGLRRAAPVPGLEAQSGIDGEEEPVIGHAATLVTHGFEGSARLLRLAAAGLRELAQQHPELRSCDSRTGFLLVLGPRQRHLRGVELVADAQTAAQLRSAIHRAGTGVPGDDAASPPLIERDRAALLVAIAAQAGLQGSPRLLRCLEDDEVSALVALQWAARWLETEAALQRIVLLAADTLLEAETVAWLENTGRLKAGAMPVGLEPGEACAALLLERHDAAAPSDRPLGVVRGTAFALEPQPLIAGAAGTGEGTARVLDGLGTSHGWARQGAAWIVSDHNGELYRANDLALALVRARGSCPSLGSATISTPATSFGDVGAARPLLGICVALAAFERRYAPADEALVLAVGESDRRAAVLIARA